LDTTETVRTRKEPEKTNIMFQKYLTHEMETFQGNLYNMENSKRGIGLAAYSERQHSKSCLKEQFHEIFDLWIFFHKQNCP
jgi:hypothetical protein